MSGDQHDVHWRLYLGRDGRPAAICVQDFDYVDYRAERFLTTDYYESEDEALRALRDAQGGACEAERAEVVAAARAWARGKLSGVELMSVVNRLECALTVASMQIDGDVSGEFGKSRSARRDVPGSACRRPR